MEPFAVICSACQSKLIVKNERFLGQVVACPKCQAPVTIHVPQKILFTPPPGVVADSVAITKVADESWMSDLDQALEAHRRETEQQTEIASSLPPSSNASSDEDEFKLEPLAPPIVPHFSIEAPVLPRETPSKSPRPKKPATHFLFQPISIAVLGIGGLIAASLLFYGFTLIFRPSPWDNAPDLSQASRDPVSTPNETDENPVPNEVRDPKTAEPSPTDLDASSTPPTDPVPDAPSVTDQSLKTENPSSPVPPAPLESQPDPKTPSTNDLTQSPAIVRPPSAVPDDIKIPEVFKIFDQTIGAGTAKQSDANPTVATETPAAAAPEFIEIADVFHPPSAPLPDLEESLQFPIAKIECVDKPINEFLVSLATITGIGIVLDLESLAAIGMTAESPISIQAEKTNLAELLSKGLLPYGLRTSSDNDQKMIIVHATDEALTSRLPKTWSLEQLVPADRYAEFGEILSRLLPDEAVHWKIEGSQVVWQPAVKPLIQSRLAVILDRVRIAIQLPAVSGYQSDALVPGLDVEGMSPKIMKSLQSINPQKRPIIQYLHASTREAGAHLVIDWGGVWKHGVTPALSDLSVTRNRNLLQIFRPYQEAYALEAAVFDSKTIWLTTPDRRRIVSQIRVFPLREGITIETLKEKLQMIAPMDFQRRSRLVVVQLPGHPFALARVCPPTMEQLQSINQVIP